MAAAVGTAALDFDGVAELWVERVEDYAKTMGVAEVVEACKGRLSSPALDRCLYLCHMVCRGGDKLSRSRNPHHDRV